MGSTPSEMIVSPTRKLKPTARRSCRWPADRVATVDERLNWESRENAGIVQIGEELAGSAILTDSKCKGLPALCARINLFVGDLPLSKAIP